MPNPFYRDDSVTIFHGDARDLLPGIDPSGVGLVLTDPPYGITANGWDRALLPDELASLLRPFRVVVMTAAQPFSSLAVVADLERFRHEWVWAKNRGSNFLNVGREPMREHETVLVFAEPAWTFNPQREPRSDPRRGGRRDSGGGLSPNHGGGLAPRQAYRLTVDRLPSSVRHFDVETGLHPTQKPLVLMEYLVLTYSNPGDLIVDPFCGSGTTLRAAKNLGRLAIGIDSSSDYCRTSADRMAQAVLCLGVLG